MKGDSYAYFMIIVLATLPLAGCMSQDAGKAASPTIPTTDLPEGFTFVGEINDSVVDMSDDVSDFEGAKEIGQVKAWAGYYRWGEEGVDYSSKITILETESPEKAEAAKDNYMAQEKYSRPPMENVSRFANATINDHNAVEIRKKVSNLRGVSLQYLYLWTNDDLVILVEGNGSPAQSRQLAEATKL